MSSLGQNDLVASINKRVLRNLAISMDHAVEDSVRWATFALDAGAFICPELGTWLARGLEHPTQLMANGALPVPQVLYATTNGAFSPALGATELDSLAKHLREFDEVASGPVDATLSSSQGTVCDMPLDLPCPITFKRDAGKRFTFVRPELFQNNVASFIDVTAQGVLITLTGTAFQGDFFSRHKAEKNPTHQFTMKLLHEIKFVESDVAFGAVPFQMVGGSPAASSADLPRLPATDEFIFARRFGEDGERNFLLPTITAYDGVDDGKGCDDPNGCQPGGLTGDLFLGLPGDLLFETREAQSTPFGDMPVPRFRVESRSADAPDRLVIREIGDPAQAILAEARGGRLALRFVKIDSLDLVPIGGGGGLSSAQMQTISKSLTKLHPTLSQSFLCVLETASGEGQAAALEDLGVLKLLGPRGLDIPLLPQNVVIPVDARVIRPVDQADINAGFPALSVRGEVIRCALTQSKYFAGANPEAQSFAVSGKIGGSGDQGFFDISDDADLTMGTSQAFLQPMLDKLGKAAMEEMKNQDLPGLDPASLAFSAILINDAIRITVSGEGEEETPWPLPNIPYSFTAKITMRMRPQKAVMVVGENAPDPINTLGCKVPPFVLSDLHLDLLENRLELPNFKSPNALPEENPLCFVTYWDPDDGIACFDKKIDTDADGIAETVVEKCPEAVRLAPPVYEDNTEEVLSELPFVEVIDPPDLCEGVDEKDNPNAFGQASFDVDGNEGLKHQYGIMALPPGEDDVEVEVDVDEGLLVGLAFLGIGLAPVVIGALGLLGPLGILATPVVAMVLITGLMLLPFAGLIASVAVTILAREKLADRFRFIDLAGLDGGKILGIYLREPTAGHPPLVLEGAQEGIPGFKGAFIVRNHIVVQSAGINTGL